jgi:hypothetical protein
MQLRRAVVTGAGVLVAAMSLACIRTQPRYYGTSGAVYVAPQNIVSVTVVNHSPQSICYMYISPVSQDTWGPDQLGATETIPPGAARQFNLPAGYWDLRADTCQHYPIATMRNALIARDVVLTVR